MIRQLKKYNNNVYLSATIDEIEGFDFYKKELRDMITEGYLCDYNITIPIFSHDPTNIKVCQYLLQNYRSIIVYCGSKKEGIQICDIFNTLQKYSANYIDCDTSTTERKIILSKYSQGEIPFLINVQVLCEGFDAAITNSVCFLHMPSSQTKIIQIIGRALRLHPLKTIANVILPYSIDEDDKAINKFMKIVAYNDYRINKSYKNKIEGGYINILNHVDQSNENEDECEFKYDKIYNNMGIKINTWEESRQLLFNCCNILGRIPQIYDLQYKNEYNWSRNQFKKIRNIENKIYRLLSEDKYVKEWLDKKFEKMSFNEHKLKLFNHANRYGRIKLPENAGEDKMTIIWFVGQKRFINSKTDKLYLIFSENTVVKDILDKYIDNKNIPKITSAEKLNILLEYCQNNIPPSNCIYKNINIGKFLHNVVLDTIKNDKHEWYIKLSPNKHLKNFIDNKLKNMEKDDINENLSWNDIKDILFEYSDINHNVPTKKIIYKNANIYSFLLDQKNTIKNKTRNSKKYTEIELYIKLSENNYVKQYLDKYFNTDHSVLLTHKDKIKLLFDYCNTFHEIPKSRHSSRIFLDGQKPKINSQDDELYKELCNNKYVKEHIDNYLTNIRFHHLVILKIKIRSVIKKEQKINQVI
jgi:hypothetical protein